MDNNFQPIDLTSDSHHVHTGLSDSEKMFSEHHQGAVGNPPEQLDLEAWEKMAANSHLNRTAEPTQPNPTREWIEQFGSLNDDFSFGIATDSNGNIYLTGRTDGNLEGQNAGGSGDIWVAKYDTTGNQLWIDQFGTSGFDDSNGIATDSNGNIYLTGYTRGDLEGQNAGSGDIWVAKYDTTGNQQWIEQFGTSGFDDSNGIATDSNGNIYLTGSTGGDLEGQNAGSGDIWVAKYDTTGNQQWIEQFGSSVLDVSNGIATDSNGNIYLTGYTGGDLEGQNAGSVDVWVAKYDTTGKQQWIDQFGSSDYDYSNGIATDSNGNIYLTGYTRGDLEGQNAGSDDAWFAKYDTTGKQQWIDQFGSLNDDYSNGIATDSNGNIYLTGYTQGNLEGQNAGNRDFWVAKYDTTGKQQWIEQFGTSGVDDSNGIAMDSSDNIYLTGYTNGNLEGQNAGAVDTWVAKYSQQTLPTLPTVTIASTDATAAETISTTTANPGEFTITRTGDTTNALTVNYTIAGKAINGTDYTQLPGSVVIPAGQSQITIPLNVIDDSTSEYIEKATLILAANNAYTVGTAQSATVNISDNDKSVVSIAAIDPNAAETAIGQPTDPGKFGVRRTGDLTLPLTVRYKVGGTAKKDSDYRLPTTITIPAGKHVVDLPLRVLDDELVEGEETATIRLVPTNNYKVAASAYTDTVTITDND
jgi:hypothetical protein